MVTDKYIIREQNEALVLNTIIREKQISRAKISTMSGLNKASVSSITKKLIEEDLILEIGEGESKLLGGRKPIILSFNKKAGLVLSMDLGPDYISGMLTYLDGEIVDYEIFEHINLNAFNIFTYIVALYTQLTTINIADFTHGMIGLSLAIHGTVIDNQIRITPNYQIGNDFITQLENYFKIPIYLENEANLAALGEYCFSNEYDYLLNLNIHRGIGSGFIQNGHIYEGSRGYSGEIGHTIIVPDGKKCPCGNKGCLEQYASNAVLIESIKEKLALEHLIINEVGQLYHTNKEVKDILLQNAKYLSIAINNLAVLFDPEVVIINHPLYHELPELIEEIQNRMISSLTDNIALQVSNLLNQATLLGGVANVIKKYLNIEDLKLTSLTSLHTEG
ncbi:ROK family protein [Fundicoccus sp. Sow4_H7]|uniref:ROK family protein n=1 Tax=Fundicoccus sp. Sow4_H7 TaxID=3438784 RepID=UPI003F909119